MKRTAEDIVYSIRHILKKLNVKTDDVNDRALMQRIPVYANFWMQDLYSKRRLIDLSWYLRLGLVQTVNVNTGDDPNVMNGNSCRRCCRCGISISQTACSCYNNR